MVYCGFGGSSLHACHTTNRLSTPFFNGLSFCHLFGVVFVENKIKSKRFNPYSLLNSLEAVVVPQNTANVRTSIKRPTSIYPSLFLIAGRIIQYTYFSKGFDFLLSY